ncbi:MAG TPA: PAS domain S-box protein [Puia sp.]|jgi:PAS domain S-box-containing protein|nr:PAS domain S-box protein [Puia sp.]
MGSPEIFEYKKMSKLRKTGIDVLGDVPWGSHFCNFYETKQDMLDITVPYFKAGLESKEFCMWVVSNSEPINVQEATQALKQAIPDLDRHLLEGNIEIHNEPDWYLKENVFNLERVINEWHANLKRALARGYEGIRVAGDTFWLTEKHWKDFYAYEKEINNFIINLPITLLCTYPLAQSKAADVLDVAHAHQFTIARRQGEWEVIESAGLMHAQAELKRLTESKLRVKEQSRKPSAILSYGLAILNVVAATAILILMMINLADATPYTSVFLCAVIFSTWFGGVGPGLVSIALSAIAFDYFFLPPIHTFAIEPTQYSRIVLFMIPSLFIVWVSANQRKVTQSLRQTSNTLEGTVEKLSQANTSLHEEIAERKKSELLIIKEKELSNEIIDSIPGVFLMHDEDRKFIRWNKHFEVISGYTAEEIPLLYTRSNFYDEEDKKKKLDNIFQQIYATGASTYELDLRMKDGRKSSYYFNSRLINYEGNPCILCTGIDITERKQAEEKLYAKEQEFRAIVENAPDQIVRFDRQFRLMYVNPAVTKAYDLPKEALVGMSINTVIRDAGIDVKDEVLAVVRQQIASVFDTGNSDAYELHWATHTGLKWYDARVFPELDLNSSVISVLVIARDITERKQAEDTIRQSEDRIRLIIDTVPALIHTGLPDGQLDFFNQRWLDFVGLSLEDLSGWKWTAAIHPEDVATMVERWRTALARGEPYDHEARVRRADGEYRWMVHREVPLRDEQGTILKWYAYSIDIEDRKRVEDALRQSDERFAAFMDNLPGYAWMKDLQGHYVYVNEMVKGLPRYRSLGKTDEQIWPADLAAEYRANDQQVITAKKALHTLEHFQVEGKHRYMAGSKFPILDKTGDVALVGGVGVDITERIEAEEAVRRSEEHLRLVIDTIPIMAWSTRPDGIVNFLNQRWLDYSGLSLEQYVKDPNGPIHPEDIPRVMEKWLMIMTSEKAYDDEMRLRRADGEYRWFMVRTAPLHDEQGKLVNWYGVASDIENSKRAEDELRLAHQRLSYHFENTPLAVIEFDKDLCIKRWSKRAEEIFGWETSEALGKNVFDVDFPIIYKEDIPAVKTINEQLTKGVVNRNLSLNRNYTKDGNVIYCEWYNSVLRDEHGNVITILSLAHNVTERKKAEETLNKSYEEIRRLTGHLQKIREEERTAIAREIHDELGQQLTAIKMDVVWIDKKTPEETSAIKNKLKNIIGLLDGSNQSVRKILSELRTGILDGLSLMEALKWQSWQFTERTGIPVEITTIEKAIELPEEIATCIFRVYQESLTNIMRYAQANKVLTSLAISDNSILFTIEDDGQGFDTASVQHSESFGILGMKERVASVKGIFNLVSAQGKGTSISISIPYDT